MSAPPWDLPPAALEAEQAVLGSLLIAPKFVTAAMDVVTVRDFYHGPHRLIWSAILELERCGQAIDPLTVAEELDDQGCLEQAGGRACIFHLVDAVPTALHWEWYAKIVADKSLRRRLIEASVEIHTWARDESQEVGQLLDRSEQAIFALAREPRQGSAVSMREAVIEETSRLEKAMEAEAHVTGTPSGLAELDSLTQGFQPGDLIIVAGRPSMGKSAFCHHCAIAGAQETGKAVLIFSLEMSRSQVTQRLISSEARIDSARLRSGILRECGWAGISDLTNITRAGGRLGELPVYIDDSSLLTPMEIRSRARRLAKEIPLSLIVVDYLQQVHGDVAGQNRNQEVGETARALKSLGRELSVPVMGLSQLSRNTERREDKRPLLSDLRESGDIEAESDLVLMLYRASYYERGEAGDANDAGEIDAVEMLIAKHRNGPVGTVKLGFLRRYTRFEDLADG